MSGKADEQSAAPETIKKLQEWYQEALHSAVFWEATNCDNFLTLWMRWPNECK